MGRSWRSDARHETVAPALGGAAPAPLAVYEHAGQANRIVALCDRAAGAGLEIGVGLADVRARFPALDVVEADPAADRQLLEAVADWCDRYTPLVALDVPQGLVLDISGCAHLFGGERALMTDLLTRLFHQGFAASAAIAGHAGTATALAPHRPGACVAEGEEQAAVGPLPVSALRVAGDRVAALERLGLKSLGALLALPRASLARRFGEGLLARLDEVSGAASRPISPRLPVPDLIAERRFAQPICLVEDIERILEHLSARLRTDLDRRGQGARSLELTLFRVDGKVDRLAVGTSRPLRDPVRIGRLFRERIKGLGEELDAGFGYDLVRLSVLKTEPMADRQTDLAGEAGDDGDLHGLVDRIGARLGPSSILRLEAMESHRPERAVRVRPAADVPDPKRVEGRRTKAGRKEEASREAAFGGVRPVRLLRAPEPVQATFEVPEGVPMNFRWRRALHIVRRFEGPERIAPEWWRAPGERTRDYYRVEDSAGRRYWLFRETFGKDEEEESETFVVATVARWYLHGIFA